MKEKIRKEENSIQIQKTKVSKNLFTTNYLINLNLNLKSGKNRHKKWQEQDKII